MLGIHANVRLESEVPLLPFARLVHLRITMPLWFFVEEGAWIRVASTIVPVAMRMSLEAR